MRIYFTTDLHGSQKCWLKFLATPKYYQADVIIIGGDITGKFVVPIVHHPRGHAEATYMGLKRKLKKQEDIDQLKQQIAYAGQYAAEMSVEEHEQFAQDPSLIEPLFARLLTERVEEWVRLADERLAGQNVRCLISAGNDDLFEVDEVLKSSKTIEALDGEIVDLDGFEMLGLGYSNPTPWDCPRDITEEQLAAKIDSLAGGIQRMDQAVFCIHVPPYDTGIDAAPELTQDMSMVLDPIGQPNMVPVGSTAVREAILKYQPMLGLHGHIHESRGVRQLGRTTLVNPGSEYAEGILHGAVFELESGKGLGQVNLVEG